MTGLEPAASGATDPKRRSGSVVPLRFCWGISTQPWCDERPDRTISCAEFHIRCTCLTSAELGEDGPEGAPPNRSIRPGYVTIKM